MTKRRVEWTAEARDDLLQVVDFITFDNPVAAEHILYHLRTRALTLDRFAERGRLVPELRDTRFRQYRELIVKPWRMIYSIEKHVVRVIALFDGRRDLRELLHERFARTSTLRGGK